MPYSLSMKLGQMLDRALFAINDHEGLVRAQETLREVVAHVGGLRSAGEAPEIMYQRGAAELLQSLLVRVVERKDGNRAIEFVRKRKHVRDILHILALSNEPVLPSSIASQLGIQQSAVTSLLKDAEEFGLVVKARVFGDGRNRPRALTRAGRAALTTVKPDWAIAAAPRHQNLAEVQIERRRISGSGMHLQNIVNAEIDPIVAIYSSGVSIADSNISGPYYARRMNAIVERVLPAGSEPSRIFRPSEFVIDSIDAVPVPRKRTGHTIINNKSHDLRGRTHGR